MKLLLFILFAFPFLAEAKITIYDQILEGKGSDFQIKEECADLISKVPRENFKDQELVQWIQPLNEFTNKNYFFHYTDAEVFLELFDDEAPTPNNWEQVMGHSYRSKGINFAGNGFYIAVDPFSSRSYGSIQLRVTLDHKAKMIYDPRNERVIKTLKSKAEVLGLKECLNEPLLRTIYLQENGVDLIYYEYWKNWFMLINEDIVQETALLTNIDSTHDVYVEMARVDRLGEATNALTGSLETALMRNFSFMDRCDEKAKSTDCSLSESDYEILVHGIFKLNDSETMKYFIQSLPYVSLQRYPFLASIIVEESREGNKEMAKRLVAAGCEAYDLRVRPLVSLMDHIIEEAPKNLKNDLKKLQKNNCKRFKE